MLTTQINNLVRYVDRRVTPQRQGLWAEDYLFTTVGAASQESKMKLFIPNPHKGSAVWYLPLSFLKPYLGLFSKNTKVSRCF